MASTLFVILMLDNPWSGDTALKPEAFEHIHTMQDRMQHPEVAP